MAIQIKEIRASRALLVAKMKNLQVKGEGDDGLTPEEATEFEALATQVASHDGRIGRLEAVNAAEAGDAADTSDDDETKSADDNDEDEDTKSFVPSNIKAFNASRVRVAATAKGAEASGAENALMAIISKAYDDVPWNGDKKFKSGRDMLLKTVGANAVTKALAATAGNPNGGALIVQTFLPQLIELLRSKVVMRALPTRKVELVGSLTIPRQTATGMAAWQGELDEIVVSNPTLDDIVLTPHKLTAMSTLTNDLIRRSPIDALNWVRDDLQKRVARYEDIAMIRGTGTNGQPAGLLTLAGSNTITYTAPSGTAAIADYAGVLAFLSQMTNQLEAANVPMISPVWIMHPTTRNFLKAMRTQYAAGPWFPEVEQGELLGFPIATTTQIPINLTASNKGTEIYLVDASEYIVADVMSPQIEVSREASYRDPTSGLLVSAFSLDQTVCRLIEELDVSLNHPQSVVVGLVSDWYPFG